MSAAQRSTDFKFILGLRETIHQLAMANSVRWYGHGERERSCFEKGIRF